MPLAENESQGHKVTDQQKF